VSTLNLLVPLDASEQALAALPVAKRLAEIEGATLHIAHFAPEAAPPTAMVARLGLSAADLRGAVLHAEAGYPARDIVRAAIDLPAALIVMCTHTTPCEGDKIVGHTALAVLANAPCPVVLVRPERGDAPYSVRRILLPHDGTPTTSAAIRPAAAMARKARAEIGVLYVADPAAAPPLERGSLPPPLYMDQPHHEWPAWAAEFLERLCSACPLDELAVRVFVAHGAPGVEALRFAAEHASDLIVLAWHGNWEGTHAATLKTVIRNAPAPVMVIRDPARLPAMTAAEGRAQPV
jgi:nucleotide-binding universal stress UspA family protein